MKGLTEKKIELTENAKIVLEKRYLKPNETPEALLWRVARNVALADILYDESIAQAKILKNVSACRIPGDKKKQTADITLLYNENTDNFETSKILINNYISQLMPEIAGKSENIKLLEGLLQNFAEVEKKSYEENFKQYLENLNSNYDNSKKAKESAEEFYEIMAALEFLPNSPTLMNAGSTLQQLSACFVLPVDDDIKKIYQTLSEAALIHKSGGGTGFSFSRLRPKNDCVKTTKGVASGPISFMRVYNASTEEIKQGGTRRGANMGVLRIDHPDIIDFITCKKDDKSLTNFNISVAITDKFMKAVKSNGEFELINPRTGEISGKLPAREIWGLLVSNAWRNGDPGVIFIDRINEENPTPAHGSIESTNPCGEQPLLPYESCNLGSINLARMVKNGKINYERLTRVIHCAVHFLDNVIDMNKYPTQSIEKLTKSNRKIGLGVMGFADMLAQLGIAYNSMESIDTAEAIMNFIQREARKASAALAAARGAFHNFDGSIYDKNSEYFKGNDLKLRNATLTTIAPTGTISTIAGAWGGIEPYFAVCYEKRVMDGTILKEINPYLISSLKKAGLYNEEIISKIKNSGSLKGIEEIPPALKDIFITAHEVPYEWHIKIQAAFQKFSDNAVSKTINFSNSATMQDVENAYMAAFDLNLKGITVYRDGSKGEQVYYSGKSGAAGTAGAETIKTQPKSEKENLKEKRKTPQIADGTRIRKDTGCGMLYVHVYKDLDGKEIEIFADLGKAGGCPSAFTEGLGRLSSLALKHGASMEEIRDELIEIKCAKEKGFGENYVASCLDGVGKAIHDYIKLKELAETRAADNTTHDNKNSETHSGAEPDMHQAKSDENFKGGIAQTLSLSGNGKNGGSYMNLISKSGGQSGACPECGGTLDYVEGCRGGKCRNPACSYYTCG